MESEFDENLLEALIWNLQLPAMTSDDGASHNMRIAKKFLATHDAAIRAEDADRAVKCFLKCMVESDLATGQDYAVLVISDKIRAAIMGEG